MARFEYEVRDATMDDVRYISDNMRQIDRHEIYAMAGSRPYRAVRAGFMLSKRCRVGVVNGSPVCIYGVVNKSVFTTEGSVWMLGTDELRRHAVRFLRMNKESSEIDLITKGFDYVDNWCHNENKITIKWLQWLGFNVRDKAEPKGFKGEDFRYFWKDLTNV